MNKPFPSMLSLLTALLTVCYVGYYVLLNDNFLHTSIACIIHSSRHFAVNAHLLVLGLLPVYIATMIFGAAFIGIYLGSRLECLILSTVKSE